MEDITFKNIGSFKLKSNYLIIIDPCLDESNIKDSTKIKAMPGVWFANSYIIKEDDQIKIEDLLLVNSEYSSIMINKNPYKTISSVSELLGIYELDSFNKDSHEWFIDQSLATNNENNIGILDYGVVCNVPSHQEFSIYTGVHNEYVVSIQINFNNSNKKTEI